MTEDGYELQFVVNHLAPFLLTHELMPYLEKATSARIVTVSSGSHYGARIRWKDVMHRRHYNILLAYQQSKLANILFSAELNRRVGKSFTHSRLCCRPWTCRYPDWLEEHLRNRKLVWHKRMEGGVSPEQGAETIIYLATDPSVEDSNEVYWKDCQPKTPSRYARRTMEADRLWELSERLCGIA